MNDHHGIAKLVIWRQTKFSPESRVPSPESRVPSPESRVPSPESRVPSPESRVPSPESRVPSPESRVPSPESRVPSPESRVPSPESRVPSLQGTAGKWGGWSGLATGALTLGGLGLVALAGPAPAWASICDRTPEVQTAILELIDGTIACEDVTDTHLSQITTSPLRVESLDNLKENDFAGLSKLQNLFLNNNSLSSLDAGIFTGLASLQALRLESNALSSLPENLFAGLSRLRWLFLNDNSLSSLDADIFSDLSSLREIYLSRNALSSLPENIFAGLSRLNILNLDGNDLVCLPRSVPWDRVANNGLLSLNVDLPDCFGVSLSVTPTEVNEGNGGESIMVTAALPAGPRGRQVDTEVTISVEQSTASQDVDFTAVDGFFTITIPNGNDSATGTFTLTARMDTVKEPDGETVLVSGATILSSSSMPGTEVSDATVTIQDAFVIVQPTNLNLNEVGTATYTLVLDAQPPGAVTITPASDDSSAVSLSPNRLTFTTSNWNTAQTVSVTGVQDDDATDEIVTISHSISSYGTVSVGSVITISLTDDDDPAVSVCDRTPAVQTAIISAIDMDSVTACTDISVIHLSRIEGLNLESKGLNSLKENDFAGLANLRGLSLNNNSLSSLDANIFNGLSNLRNLFLFSNTLSSLPEDIFAGLANLWGLYVSGNGLDCLPRSVPWDRVASGDLILDVDIGGGNLPDCFGVSLSVTPTAVHESNIGENIMVTATLTNGPRGRRVDTEVSISVSADTAIEGVDFTVVDDFTITIPNGSASAAGTFTLTATVDNEREGGETVRLSGRSTMGDYAAPVGSTTVTINDALVSVWPIRLNTTEGGTAAYTVTLISQPAGTVTVTPARGNSGALAVSPASLTFTTANWNTARTVTVTGVQDNDGDDETVTIRHGVSGDGSLTAAAAVTVSVTDDDAPETSVCERTPAVQDAILDAIDGITACADVTVHHLNQVTETLNLFDQSLSTLKENDFADLANLEWLWLHVNSLSSLPEDIFNDLFNLQRLVLSRNSLSSLDANIFNGLANLEWLYLGDNDLSNLDANIFNGLANLQRLYLDRNSLSNLDANIFNGLANLQQLYLDRNDLSSLPDGIFAGLSKLGQLQVGDNGLLCLPRSLPWDRVTDDVLTLDVDLPDCFGVSLRVIPTEVAESGRGESVMVTAALNDGPRGRQVDTEVTVSVAEDTAGEHTATEGRDFTAVEDFTITIPNGSESATGTFTLTARRDTVVEAGGEMGGETVLVSGTSTVGDYAAEVGSTTVTILDGPRFSLSLTANASEVNEGESVYFTITRAWTDSTFTDPLPATAIWVRIGYHNKILEPGVDQPATLRRVAFEEGQESVELLAVITHDDELNDGDGMVRADLNLGASASSYDVLQGKAWTRVVDDDVPEVTLIQLKERVTEGEDGYQFQIRRSCCSERVLNLSFAVEHKFFVNKDYLLEDIYGPYFEVYNSNVNDNPEGNSILRFEPGETMKSFRYYQPVFLEQYPAGPLGGYFRLAILTYPYDARLDEDPQEIPRYGSNTFYRRYSVSETDYDKTLRIDNYAPGVSIETSQTSIVEGDEVEFTIKRFGGPPNLFSLIPHNIRMEVEQTGDYLPASELGTRVIRMELGQTEYKLKILTNNDSFNYPDGSITVTLLEGAPTGLGEDTYDLGSYRPIRQASVDITDDDGELSEIALSPTELQIPEGGSGTYTVMLTSPPENGEMTIRPFKVRGGDPDVAVASSTLTFSADDWNIPQTVTVTTEEDDDMDDDSAEIVHYFPSSQSSLVNIFIFTPSVQVSILDDDLPRVSLSISDDFISEAGGTATVTATLSESLTTSTSLNVLVTPVAPAGSADYQLSSSSTLTFSAGATTAEGIVTITAVNNDVDAPDKVLRVRGKVTGESNIPVNNELELVIQDDDSRGLTASTNTLSIHEGHTGTYTVVLDTQPTGDVTVTPSRSSGDTDMTISDALTFSASNWNTPQTVTIAAPEDGDDEDGIASIIHRTSGGDYDSLGQLGIVIVNITDNDTPGVTLSKTTLAIDEGSSETYTVVLNTQPTGGDVIITPSRSSGDEDVTVSRALIFSSGNWNLPQTVTVRAADDDDPNDDTATITHAVSGANYGAVTADSVQVSVTDSDPRGVTLSETTLNIHEGGTATYTVVLNTLPSGNVTITPSRSAGGDTDVTVSAAIVFSTTNWNIPQTVTVHAADDNDPNDDAATLVHAVSGADYAVVIAASVDVIVTDNDTRGITLSETALTFNEGSTGIYTVVLNTQPTGDVTVTPSRSDDSDTDVTVSDVLTFSISNWNTPQAVTVHAAEDNDPDNDTATIAHAVSGADYDTITAAPAVAVTVTDNDTRGITLSETTLSFNEGSTVTYTVVLNTQPTGDVTVTPSRSDDSDTDVTVSSALTFSTGNWNTPQTVTINAAEDHDASNDTATITHTVSGADYGSVAAASVDVTVTDSDTRSVTISETALTFGEGGTVTYSVVLDTRPTGDVTVTPSRSDGSDTDVTVSNALTFSTGNWNIPQTVTVNAAEDDDASNDTATINNIVSGADYDSVTAASVQVTVTDNDTRGVTISETALTFNERGTATYTVVLDTQPTGDVTVTPSRSDDSDTDVTVSNTLAFSTGNWNTPQTVTVNAAEDSDASNDMATITHAVSGADYGSVTAASVDVIVTDNDTRGITISETTLTFDEGGTVTYTVVLDTQPTSDVTVTPSRSDDSDRDVTVSDALTFSTGNWNIPQTVTINAAEDSDASNDMATITHTVSGADYGSVTAASVDVTVTDSDTRSVTISETALTFTEGGTVTYTVVLDTQPTGDVTVTPSRSDGSDTDVTVSNALTFSTGNWNISQTVTINAAEDSDASNDMATITHTISGADYGSVTAASVDVTVTDSDTRGITVSETTLAFNEGGTATYAVVLDTQPTGEVTVTPSKTNDSDTDVTISNALTFSTDNWNTPQTVTVNAAEDNDASNDTATITHTVSGADYGSVTAASVDVTVTDSDTRGITVSETTLAFNEGGTATYAVVLDTQPTGDVTVTPSRSDGSDKDVSVSNALTFSTDNWNTPQTVTVNAAEDSDASNDTATITHTVSGADYGSVTAASIDVIVTDNDTRGVTVSEIALTFDEGGTVTYTVVLDTQPTGDVTVTPSRSDGSDTDVTVSNALTFSTGNWNIPQTVTVNAAEDSDASNDTATITHAVSGADYDAVAAASVGVVVTDSDTRGVTISELTLTFSEGGTITYTVVLNTQPTGDVTVTPSRTDGSDRDVTVSNALTFSTGNWNIPQTVTVNAAEDDDASNDTATIDNIVSGADYDSVTAASVQVTVTDNDTRGVTISETALTFDEGGTVTYTVVLNTQPTGDVTVTPSRSDGSDTNVTVSNALTFSTGNWNTPQTVTVSAIEDSDASNDTATITHAVSGADYASVTATSVGVVVTDSDTRGVTVSETALTFDEGGTVTYTVVLDTQPTGDVTVTPSRSDDSDTDVTVSSALVFSTGNWNTPQTVTVNAAEDSDASNDAATITHTVSGADYASVTAASVNVTVTDSDTRGVTISEATLTFNEGGTATYTVVLKTQPTGDVTVTPSRTDGSDTDVTVSNALTFSTGNWNTPQTVTVNAAEDDDASNDMAIINHAVSGADYGSIAAASVDVVVTDNDTISSNPSESNLNNNARGVTLSDFTLSINEGSNGTYTVVLNTQPTGNVIVTPSRSDSNRDVSVSGVLTFSVGNWDTAQTVTISAAEDPDANDDSSTIAHFVSGADYDSVTAASVDVIVIDDDIRGVTISESTLSVNEGSTVTYTVTLVTQPSGNVTITPTSGDSDAVSVEPARLTFTPSNWNTPWTVRVTAEVDDDTANETVIISHSVSGYKAVTSADAVTVSVTDNSLRGVTLSKTSLTFNEGDAGTYTVVLDTQPTSDVTVTPSRTDDSDTDVTVSNALTFSTGNWDTPQTVTVNAAEDNDASNDTATITHAVSGADYASVTAASIDVIVTDSDTRGITVSETTLTFNEGGTATYTVVLHTQPTGDVTVTPSRSDDSDTDVTVSNALTFSTGNWNTPQTVTVNAAEDSDASNDMATITHTVSGTDYGSVTAASVDVIVTDSNTRGITISETTLAFNEGGTATYTVVLDTQPTGDVTVTPSKTDDSDTDVTVSNALTFSTGNWNIPQTVTVNAAKDNDASNDIATINHVVSGADYGSVTAASVDVTVTDSDTRGVTISETALTFDEGGTVTYTVVLDTQPTGDVTVTPSKTDDSDTDVTVSNALTFSTGNWNTPQTVTVNAAEDNDASNDTATIAHTVSGADYGSVTAASVDVSVTDNDARGITVSETTLAFNEGGTATYTVVLNTRPTGDVTVTPSRTEGSDTDVTVSSPLTFSTGNWNTPQTVTVNAAEDSDASNDAATIAHTVSGADYGSVTAASVDVSVTDNDARGITVSETTLAFNEGGTATYTVVLNTQPTGDVTVTPSRTDDSDRDVTISNALTFSTGNWNIPQTVTVNAAEDNDASNDTATITHTVSGADYGSVTAASVDVTVTDNDTRGITVSETTLAFNEGSTATYTVVLNTQPTGDVTVTPSRTGGSDTDVTVSGALTFSTGNWNTPQTVTVNAAEDSDASNDAATIAHTVSGADYGSVTAASVDVSVTDNDARGITVSETTLAFNEGGTATYTVVLNTQPTGDVTVTPSRTDDSDRDVTISNALTFSTGNWNIPQTVTVNAAEDNDASNDTATITHTVSGADYGSVTAASVDVTVTDNDTRGITVSETTLAFNEGGTATYTVVLNTQPTGDVTVTPSRSGGSDTDVTVSNALIFSTGNWNIPQTVTVNAAEDSDASNDTATIAHTVSGADYGSVTAASVDVSVTDNDARGITVSETTLTFNEGGTATYTVMLNTQTTGDVTVTPSRTDDSDADVTVSNALTFSTGNWNTPQTVTVTAVEDNDASNDAATITHTVSGADYDTVTAASVDVTVTDSNTRGVTISETTLNMNEGGTATYTVVLNTQPSGDVTVTPSRTDDSDTDVTVSNALTFSTSNWNTPQTVTVNAAEDNDASNDMATITHTVSGADYGSVSAASVQVTIIDSDTRGVTISETALTFNEGGTATYTVMLNTQTTGDVTVTPSRTDDSDADVTVSNALTFSTGNWNTPQTVTVNAAEDNDASNDMATITHTVSGADYGSITAASVQVIVTDNDTRGVTISEAALTFNEEGTATYTVVLNTQPSGDVTVTPSRSDDSDTDVTVSNALTFSTGNWNTPQTVTVNAAEDNDASNDTATITHTVSGADYGSITAASVQVTVTDNDNRGVTISEAALTFNEEGTATYTVVLNTQPTGDVTVTPSRSDDSDTDVTVSNALTFSTGNWNTPQTVTVNAAEDNDASNDTATITHTVSGADYGSITAASVQVTVTDNDNRGVTISEAALTFNEEGTATYTVVLNTQPTADVTVTLSRTDGSDTDVTVSNALTFSTGNWNTPQTVTINAAEDNDASNDAATITHTVSGADYGSITAASVDVTVTDNDNRGVTISETALTFNEGGTATYTVVLNTQPTGNVTVTPSRSSGDTDVTVSNALVFSTGNWNTPQIVTINAAEDSDASNDAATITHAVSGADYDSITADFVDVTVTDSDTPGITVSTTALTLNEGDTRTYTIVLNTQPTADVTVTPSRTDGSDTDVTVSNALVFSTGNWDTPQTVTVTAAEDRDASNDAATITHAVLGADYGSVTAASVQVIVNDHGTPSTVLTLTISPAIVQEEDETREMTLTGTLNQAPWTTDINLLVTIGAAGDSAIEGVDYSQIDALTLTIPAGEITGTTTFNLTLLDDSIDEQDETILVTGNHLNLQVLPTTITIRNNDPMPQGWLSRFGRTVADQVMDAVAGRLDTSRHLGIDAQLAGQNLNTFFTADHLQRLWSQKITEEDLLADSSFTLTTGTEETGFAGLWGQGSISHFRGREETVSLDGEVLSAMLGMDWTHDSTAAGLLLSHASGQGNFRSSVDEGTVAANLTGLYPYAHYVFNEQLALWSILGYGQGDYTLTPKDMSTIESDISLVMAALSGRNALVKPSVDDELEIALKADLLVVHLSSEEVSGMFKGAEALVTRFRLGLEGSRHLQLHHDHLLTPSFEVALRRDGGHAETGFGADIGMGLVWANPALGITSELRGRTLLTHTTEDFHEKGLSLDFSYDPTPSSEHGFSLSLSQTMGAAATGGMAALLSPVTLEMPDSPSDNGQQQFEARLAYGFPILSDAFDMTPSLGFALSPQNNTYGIGLMFSSSESHPHTTTNLNISLEVERREPSNPDDTPEHSLQLRFLFPLEGTH